MFLKQINTKTLETAYTIFSKACTIWAIVGVNRFLAFLASERSVSFVFWGRGT